MFNFIKNLFTNKEKSAKLLQDVQYVTREHFNRNPDGITAIIVVWQLNEFLLERRQLCEERCLDFLSGFILRSGL